MPLRHLQHFLIQTCLLYTSDAADEHRDVEYAVGGRSG